jgi:hypothetical protein
LVKVIDQADAGGPDTGLHLGPATRFALRDDPHLECPGPFGHC